MKKIQLTFLAVIMIISAAGAYGNYHSGSQVYDIMPNTLNTATSYQVASVPPSGNCIGAATLVCSVIASSGYSSGQFIPAPSATIYTEYE